MTETNQLLKTIQETKSDGLNTLMESLDDLTFSQYLNHILEIKHVTIEDNDSKKLWVSNI